MQWKEGPAPPVSMYQPCAVTISPTCFLAISVTHIREFDADIAGPTSIKGWREEGRWPRLKTSRLHWPGCAKIGQKVIIAGGFTTGGEGVLRSTVVLDLGSRLSQAGGDMVMPRHWFHLATIRRGGEETVFAVAGDSISGDRVGAYLDTVEELVEVEENATWGKTDGLLAERRAYFAMCAVPKELICEA